MTSENRIFRLYKMFDWLLYILWKLRDPFTLNSVFNGVVSCILHSSPLSGRWTTGVFFLPGRWSTRCFLLTRWMVCQVFSSYQMDGLPGVFFHRRGCLFSFLHKGWVWHSLTIWCCCLCFGSCSWYHLLRPILQMFSLVFHRNLIVSGLALGFKPFLSHFCLSTCRVLFWFWHVAIQFSQHLL